MAEWPESGIFDLNLRQINPPRFAWCEAAGGTFDLSGDSYPLSKGCLPLDCKETNVDWIDRETHSGQSATNAMFGGWYWTDQCGRVLDRPMAETRRCRCHRELSRSLSQFTLTVAAAPLLRWSTDWLALCLGIYPLRLCTLQKRRHALMTRCTIAPGLASCESLVWTVHWVDEPAERANWLGIVQQWPFCRKLFLCCI